MLAAGVPIGEIEDSFNHTTGDVEAKKAKKWGMTLIVWMETDDPDAAPAPPVTMSLATVMAMSVSTPPDYSHTEKVVLDDYGAQTTRDFANFCISSQGFHIVNQMV